MNEVPTEAREGDATRARRALIELDEAMSWLEARSSSTARVADARLFAGVSEADLSALLGASPEEARIAWRAARAWILLRIDDPSGAESAEFEATDRGLRAALAAGRADDGGDAWVRRLLRYDRLEDARVDGLELSGSASAMASSAAPDIPGYVILGRVGEGGMGTVYEARQAQPSRRVALKVLRPGLLERSVQRRFELEVELLARLQHPGVAQVFATGTFEGPGGPQPWFAMELIEGAGLLEHARALPVSERVELVARIADAVQHAHQRGVIHRDLKPENILVDGSGQPKVLDFGVGRAVEEEQQRGTLATAAGQVIGTLAYMSPEQASGDSARVDTRTDVYALGVIAYELLAGVLPIETKGRALPSALMLIQQAQPVRLGRIAPRLRGDLETIVARAMSKEPERRYASAAELAADLRRHLAHQPIEARPPSAAYQLSRFARRNRVLVSAAALLLSLAAVATAVTSGQVRRRLEAELDTTRVEREAALAAGRGAAVKDYVLNFLLASASPFAEGPEVRVRTVVELATEQIDAAFVGEPALEAELRHVLGTAWKELGEFRRARPLLERALAMRVELGGRDHPDTLATSEQLAATAVLQDDTARSLELHRTDLAIFEALQGPDGIDTLRVAHDLAVSEFRAGETSAAIARMERTLEARRRTRGEEHEETLNSTANLALMLMYSEQPDRAERLARRAFELRERQLGPDDPMTLQDLSALTGVLQSRGRAAEVVELLEPRIDAFVARFGTTHPKTQELRATLGTALMDLRRYDEARALQEAVIVALGEELGAGHSNTLSARNDLAILLQRSGARAAAEEVYLDILGLAGAALEPESAVLARVMNCYASLLTEDGRLDEAEGLYLEILRIYEELGLGSHADFVTAKANYGACLMRSGRHEEAEPYLRETTEDQVERYPAGHRYVASGRERLGRCLLELGRLDEAAELLRAAVGQPGDEVSGGPDWEARTRVLLARALLALERRDEAAVELRAARVAVGPTDAAAGEAARLLEQLGLDPE